jgi:hypothetical protein
MRNKQDYQLSDCGQFYEMKPEIKERYRATVAHQLAEWLKGNPQHNMEFDECCPDMSCCVGLHCLAELPVRERYVEACRAGDEATMHNMLLILLAHTVNEVLPETSNQLYISGFEQ